MLRKAEELKKIGKLEDPSIFFSRRYIRGYPVSRFLSSSPWDTLKYLLYCCLVISFQWLFGLISFPFYYAVVAVKGWLVFGAVLQLQLQNPERECPWRATDAIHNEIDCFLLNRFEFQEKMCSVFETLFARKFIQNKFTNFPFTYY